MSKEFNQVLVTMLWSEVNQETGEPLDSEYDLSDISDQTKEHLQSKYEYFCEIAETIFPPDMVVNWYDLAHDFWLTCRGHGAGFWDRQEYQQGNVGKQLTNACYCIYLGDPYVGDDGKIYLL